MSVLLPADPSPTEPTTPSYVEWGGTLKPVFGGAMQKLLRLGDRFAIDVTMPPIENADLGMRWVARLIAAQRDGAILRWPQPGVDVGDPGVPVVNGANQAGAMLRIRGFTAGYAVREGQFFSVLHGGRSYLHQAQADLVADTAGTMTLPIAPMLRIRPANGAPCSFAAPVIEGFLDGQSREWTLALAQTVGLAFRIMEVK